MVKRPTSRESVDDASLRGAWSRSEAAAFRKSLLAWYRKHGRPLPWRETHDPYRIWISEIMLQQTTVVAVIPYFERFLKRFPTLADLAAADEEDVLRLWEGLGYYSRGRNLLKAAKWLVAHQQGEFPQDVVALQQLAGVGRYTAGAIASFAFDVRAPIVEANTQRLYARLMRLQESLQSTTAQQKLWGFAEEILPRKSGSGEVNQAVMELGAKVCTPVSPACERCPVARFCVAFRDGLQNQIPVPKSRPAITEVHEYAIVLSQRGKTLLRRREQGERWVGLWDFPRLEIKGATRASKLSPSLGALQTLLEEEWQLTAQLERSVATMKHSVTRFRITLEVIGGTWKGRKLPAGHEWTWVSEKELESLPLSMPGRRIAKLISLRDGQPHLFQE